MMTPSEWNAVLAPAVPYQVAYAKVAEIASMFLDHSVFEDLTTAELVERLYPMRFARGEGVVAHDRLYTALAKLAKYALRDYCHPGTPRKLNGRGKLITPLIWHSFREPDAATIRKCPCCGQVIS